MENLIQIIKAILKGLIDSLSGTIVLFTLDKNIQDSVEAKKRIFEGNQVKPIVKANSEGKVLRRTLQCCGLNGGIFLLSIFMFEYGLLPCVEYFLSLLLGNSSIGKSVWSLTHTCLHLIFGTAWVVPLFFLSKVVNSLWFQDIADSAFRHTRGRPQLLSTYKDLIADSLISVLVQFLFLLQSIVVTIFPLHPFGYILSLVHMCMLYSLYAFEYKWCNMGWKLPKRLSFIESNWPYFIGFGLPLAVMTGLTSSYIISGCVFSILFPLFIISANEANPVTSVCDTPIELFKVAVAISNAIFRTITPKKQATR